MPPPSSGGIHLIQILNILENFDIVNMNIKAPAIYLLLIPKEMRGH